MATDPPALGTKWLTFWTYAGIPVVIIGAFLLTLDLPRFRYENIPIALLCLAVAVGLHKRRLWAWQWNWFVVAIVYVAMLIPVPIRESNASFPDLFARGVNQLLATRWTHEGLGDLALPIAVRLILATLIWLWPNWVYWKKRVGLFS